MKIELENLETLQKDKSINNIKNGFKKVISSSIFIIPVLFLSFCWNIPRFFELQTCYPSALDTWNQKVENNSEIANSSTETNPIKINSTRIPSKEEKSISPQVCVTELRESFHYCRDYMLIANFLVMAFLPFIFLAIFNGLTFRMIRSSSKNNKRTSKRQQRDQTIAMMLSYVVLVFFICNSARIVLNFWEVRKF